MPTATSAVRPSSSAAVGKPTVKPSTERPTIWVAPLCTPARSSNVRNGTPCHSALPTRSPPTSLDTHERVTASSTWGMPLEVVEGQLERVVDHARHRQLSSGPRRPGVRPARCRSGRSRRWARCRGSGRRRGTRRYRDASKAAGEPGGTARLLGRIRRIFSRTASIDDRERSVRPARAPVTAKAPAAPAHPKKARRVAVESVGRAITFDGAALLPGGCIRGRDDAGGGGATGSRCPVLATLNRPKRVPRPAATEKSAATTARPVEARGSSRAGDDPDDPEGGETRRPRPRAGAERRRRVRPRAAPRRSRCRPRARACRRCRAR